MNTYQSVIQTACLIIGGFVSLLAFVLTVIEYRKQGRLKRAEHFLSLTSQIQSNPDFQTIRGLIDTGDPKIKEVPKKIRSDYACTYENVALLVNSRIIRKDVACYMLSYDAVLCWESQDFWSDFDKSDKYWGVLRVFAEDMKKCRDQLSPTKRTFRV